MLGLSFLGQAPWEGAEGNTSPNWMFYSILDPDHSLEPAPFPCPYLVLQMAYRKHLEIFSRESRNDISKTLAI